MELQDFIVDCINNSRGDDLVRAKRAFSGLSPKAMQEEHGHSRKTRQDILDGYRAHERKCDDAIGFVRNAR